MTVLFQYVFVGKRNALFIAAMLLVRLFVSPFPVFASDILIINDSEIRPYRDTIKGFKSSCGCTAREIPLADIDAIEEAIKERPDAVVAVGTQTFLRIKKVESVPLIYTMVMPLETEDLTADNISGVSMDIAPEDFIAAIKEVFPGAKRIGLLYDPDHTDAFVAEARRAAHAAEIELITEKVSDPARVPAVLEGLRNHLDVLWMIPDPTVVTAQTIDFMLRFSFQQNVPLFTFSKKFVEMGAVASLSVSPYDMGAQAGEIAKELLKDGKAPVRAYARKSRLTVNTKVANKMGFKISEEVLKKVIKNE